MPALVANQAPVIAMPVARTAYAPQPPAYSPVGTPPTGVVLGAPQRESSQVLPPRPTGRMSASKGRSIWKSWPMVVIAIASLAIVAAVVLMVWPDKKAEDKKNALEPPPAPVRMDTDKDRPLPPGPTPGGPQGANPPANGDPWANRGGTPGAAPDPDDVDTIDPPSTPDPYAGGPSRTPDMSKTMGLVAGITTHFCARMKTCGATDDTMDMLCSMASKQYGTATPPTCAAATRCFEKIDAMDCAANGMNDLNDIMKLQTSMQDCMEAAKC